MPRRTAAAEALDEQETADAQRRPDAPAAVSRRHVAEDRLFSAIQHTRDEAAKGGATSELIERELLPAMRAAAHVHVSVDRRHLPGTDLDDVISYVDERIVRLLRTVDLKLDPPQIVAWIYRSLKMAIIDAQRADDTLSRRERVRANDAEARIEAVEKEIGRALTDRERQEVARKALGERQVKGRNATQLATILVTEIENRGLGDIEVAGSSDTEDEAEERYQAQALHIAGANVDDDDAHAAFVDMVNGGQLTNRGLEASVRVAITEQLQSLGMFESALPWQPRLMPVATPDEAAAQAVRPHRYFVFQVPRWGPLHDRVIDAVAVDPLGMQIGIDRSKEPTEVYAAEPPKPLWGARRWRLLAIALAEPDIAGRRAWIPYTTKIRERLPGTMSMRVISRQMYLAEIHRLRSLTSTTDVEMTVAGALNDEEETRETKSDIKHGRFKVKAIPLKALQALLPKLPRSDTPGGSELVIRRDPKHPRYLASRSSRSAPLFALPTELTASLDAECSNGATWKIDRWSIQRSTGAVIATMHRTARPHGTEGKYRYEGCRCPRCEAAKNTVQATWRASSERSDRPPNRPKPEFKHGAACRKRGCDCEIGKEAERERQRRSRERRRAAAARAAPLGPNPEVPAADNRG